MGDGNTPTLACRECGVEIFRAKPTGRNPTYCPPCKLEVNRRKKREIARRAYVPRMPPMDLTCLDCGRTFRRKSVMGKAPERCPTCAEASLGLFVREHRTTHNATRRAERRERYEHEGRWTSCKRCGAPLPCAFTGRNREWCDACWRVHCREIYRANAPADRPPIVCIDCRAVVPLARRGASGRKRCTPCAIRRARQIQRQTGDQRRAVKRGATAEIFNPRDIFTRDRWTCGICRKRINPKLSYPDPMSASLDHIVPISEGGPHTRANTRATHLTCNLRRYNLGGNEQLALIG